MINIYRIDFTIIFYFLDFLKNVDIILYSYINLEAFLLIISIQLVLKKYFFNIKIISYKRLI